jgi:ligand-binding sensor domain-containing protein
MITAGIKKIFFFLHLLLCCYIGAAQFSHTRSFELEEDHPSLSVAVIFKDRTGVLWIGTNNGVYRFNGLRAQLIALPNDSLQEVSALGETADGSIWVGFRQGTIALVKNSQATWFQPEEGLPKVAITAFYTDKSNRTWFATAGEGVYYLEGRHLYNINTRDGLTDNYVYSLAIDSAGWLMAGTDRGISFIRLTGTQKEIRSLTGKDGLPDNIVRTIAPSDIAGYWWVGMQDKGVCLLDAANRQLIHNHISSLWKHGQVNDVSDWGNELWIATEEAGVWLYDKTNHSLKKQLFSEELSSTKISDIQQDNEGNIWLANGNRVVRTAGNTLLFYPEMGSHSLKNINAVVADGKQLWLANGNELLAYEPGGAANEASRSYDVTNGQAPVTCLYRDVQGYLWIGTMGKGLMRMQTGTGNRRTITENPLLANGHILSITGNQNSVWVASLNGVTELSLSEANKSLQMPVAFRNYGKQDGIGSDYVYHLYMDSKNRLWLATDGAGVALRERGRFTNLLGEKQLKATVVYSIAEDKQGTIWLNTLNNGIYRFDGNTFSSISLTQGFSDINITSLLSCPGNGLIAVNKKGLDIYDIKKNSVTHFGKESGFVRGQVALNAVCTDENGDSWIGMEDGLVRYRPVARKQAAPFVLIEQVEIFNKAIDTTQPHIYNYDENNFRFVLSPVYYTDPEKVKFQYQLSGYNTKWETTSDNDIVFPKLTDGKYLLKLRASVTGNFDQSEERIYTFTINKPFWRQWWFLLPLLLLMALLIYWLVRSRVVKTRQKEQAKNERFRLEYDTLKSQVNPHFLFNSFNALLGVIEDQPDEAATFVQQLSSFYRKMTAYRDKDVIAVKEELQMLETYLFIQQKRYGAALQATIEVDKDVQELKVLPPLSLQLLAENAVKHNAISMETPLRLEVTVEEGFLVMRNIINPKISKEAGEGLGLQNIANRFRMLTTQPIVYENKNNIFTVKLPLLNMHAV